MYKTIADTIEDGKCNFDYLYLIPLIFHTVDILVTVFIPVVYRDSNTFNTLQITVSNVSLLQVLVLLFSPAFAAGLLKKQATKLSLVLHDKLLTGKDNRQSREIKKFIRYIEARPLKFTICEVIPLDWKLPVIILNLCITYLIVMLQLSHIY
ncbi:unnamed protein product [Chilo suppressalis]|uniref:Gustatory receptor n=1 Tax=Chilo suppressalis TaxID=168631 RepID=A0ABN8B2T0_CHISP|nr:unnamed protein product [Chilo suppressalis]